MEALTTRRSWTRRELSRSTAGAGDRPIVGLRADQLQPRASSPRSVESTADREWTMVNYRRRVVETELDDLVTGVAAKEGVVAYGQHGINEGVSPSCRGIVEAIDAEGDPGQSAPVGDLSEGQGIARGLDVPPVPGRLQCVGTPNGW